MFDLTGRTALVTGAGQNIGAGIARALGAAGATVLVNDLRSERAEEVVEALLADSHAAVAVAFDVTDRAAIDAAVAESGPIDVLVNNAAVIERTPLLDMTVEAWDTVIRTDLTGVFVMTQPVVRRMIGRGGGKVINVCSMMSELGRDSVGAYAAAKGGLKMLTRSMATEWARHGIQVNGIGPGYFATEQTAPIREPGHPFNEWIVSRTPAGRWGDPDDLAGAAVFLASAASDFVNGHVLYVDGGILATIGRPQA